MEEEGNPSRDLIGENIQDAIREEFSEQQEMIVKLREMLEKKEREKSSQRKEVEDYAQRMAKMKPRLMRGRGGSLSSRTSRAPQPSAENVASICSPNPAEISTKPTEESASVSAVVSDSPKLQPQADPSTDTVAEESRARLLLLRKQIDESRVKFERQQREKMDQRAEMEEMKQRILSLRQEIEEREEVIQGIQDGTSKLEPSMQQLFKQIMDKDNTILKLTEQVDHLESLLQEHKEQMEEKDQIISARTEAVALVAEERDKKMSALLEDFEEAQCELKSLRLKLQERESHLKEVEQQAEKESDAKLRRVHVLEENCQRMESVRFELSARNAELQEKVVTLQSDMEEMKRKNKEFECTISMKIGEVSELKRKLCKAEAFGSKKLQALEKQVAKMDKGNATENILDLQNKIAQLEEEKGNLQLKLVDFDDTKVENVKLRNLNDNLSEEVNNLRGEVKGQGLSLSEYSIDKANLVEELNRCKTLMVSLEESEGSLKNRIEELKQEKITLELKICSLEEIVDSKPEEASGEVDKVVDVKECGATEELTELKSKLTLAENKITSLLADNEQLNIKLEYERIELEKKGETFESMRLEKEKKKDENRHLLSMLADHENTLTSNSITLDTQKEEIDQLKNELRSKLDIILHQNQSLAESGQQLNDISISLQKQKEGNLELELKTEDLQSELDSALETIAMLRVSEKELKDHIDNLKLSLETSKRELLDVKGDNDHKNTVICDYLEKLKRLEVTLAAKSEEIKDLHSSFQKYRSKAKEEIDSLNFKTKDLDKVVDSLQKIKKNLEGELNIVTAVLADKENAVSHLMEQLKIKEEQLNNSEIMTSKFEVELCEKNRNYDDLDEKYKILEVSSNELKEQLKMALSDLNSTAAEVSELQKTIVDLSHSAATSESQVANLNSRREELEKLITQKERDCIELEEKLNKLNVEHVYTLDSGQKEINDLQTNLTYAQADASKLTEELEDFKQAYLAAEEQINTYIGELVQSRERESNLESTLEVKNSEMDTIRARLLELEGKQERAEGLENTLTDNRQQLREYETIVEDMKASKQMLEQEIQSLRGELSLKHEEFRLQLEEKNSSCSFMESEVAAKSEEAKLLAEEINEKEAEICGKNKEIEEALGAISQRDEMLHQLHGEITAKIEEIQVLSNIIEVKDAELCHMKTDLQSKDIELSGVTSSNQEYCRENEQLRSELEDKGNAMRELEKSLGQNLLDEGVANGLRQELKLKEDKIQQLSIELEEALHFNQDVKGGFQSEEEVKVLKQKHDSYESTQGKHDTQFIGDSVGEVIGAEGTLKISDQDGLRLQHENLDAYGVDIERLNKEKDMLSQDLLHCQNLNIELQKQLEGKERSIECLTRELEGLTTARTAEDDKAEASLVEGAREVLPSATLFFPTGEGVTGESQLMSSLSSSAHSDLVTELEQKLLVLEREKKLLEENLQNSQEIIVQLETSIATELPSVEASPDKEEWGKVDLGPVQQSSLTMQTSLVEKDKAINVIQEQLRIALQQVNTINDEKKLLEHELHLTKESLKSKTEECRSCQDELLKINSRENKSMEKHSQLEVGTLSCDRLSKDQTEFESSSIVKAFDNTTEGIEGDPPMWFKHSQVEQQTTEQTEHIATSIYLDTTVVSSESPLYQTASVAKSELPSDSETSNQVMSPETLVRLQWYDEQWPILAEYYDILQQNYQEAQKKISTLSQQLETLEISNETSSLTVETRANVDTSRKDELVTPNEEVLGPVSDVLQSKSLQVCSADSERLALSGTAMTDEESKYAGTDKNQETFVALKEKISRIEGEIARLSTGLAESEAREDSLKSRNQELELIVQSADSEISRLKGEITDKSSAIFNMQNEIAELQQEDSEKENLESEFGLQSQSQEAKMSEEQKNRLLEELERVTEEKMLYEEEMRKWSEERISCNEEITSLKGQVDMYSKEVSDLQEMATNLQEALNECRERFDEQQGEIVQLRSEVEVYEGDLARQRVTADVLEEDIQRLRIENEEALQNNQVLHAQQESLQIQLDEISREKIELELKIEHCNGEMQRMSEVETSAESEIARLKKKQAEEREAYMKQLELAGTHKGESVERVEGTKEKEAMELEEVDWGEEAIMEDYHSQKTTLREKEIEKELKFLKESLAKVEQENLNLGKDFGALKLKNTKVVQKLKASLVVNESLRKEIDRLKSGTGLVDLNETLEQEWKEQINIVEQEKDEIKIKFDEVEKEKSALLEKVDLLESAQEKYLDLKEEQDRQLGELNLQNQKLKSEVASLEWKISELEEKAICTEMGSGGETDFEPFTENANAEASIESESIDRLNTEESKKSMKDDKNNILMEKEKVEIELSALLKEKIQLESKVEELESGWRKLEETANGYKTSYIELHDNHILVSDRCKELDVKVEELEGQLETLKAAYNSLFEDVHRVKDERDIARFDLGIVQGQADRLQEEVDGLQAQIEAMHWEGENDVIKVLQSETTQFRNTNSMLRDQISMLEESLRQSEEEKESSKRSLDRQIEMQHLHREEMLKQDRMLEENKNTISSLESEVKYMKAAAQAQQTAHKSLEDAFTQIQEQTEKVEVKLEKERKRNEELVQQLKVVGLASEERGEAQDASTSAVLRDLRCQQLQSEVNKLLEERDVLQLKLSSSLRQVQELRKELSSGQHKQSSTDFHSSLNKKLNELQGLSSSSSYSTSPGRSKVQPPTQPTFVAHTAPATPTASAAHNKKATRPNAPPTPGIMDWVLGRSPSKEVLHV